MSELPEGWAHASMANLVLFNPKTDIPDDSDCAFAPMQHLGTRFLGKLGFEIKTWSEVKKAYTHFKNGDVLLAKVTPCFENGKAGIAENLPNGIGAGSSEFMVMRPIGGVNNRYLLAWLSTVNFRRRATTAMTGSVGLKRVPKDFVMGELIPVAPLLEQRRIADKLDTTLARVDACRDRLARVAPLLKRFRQSVLAAATSGRLTEDWRLNNSHELEATEERHTALESQRAAMWQGRGKYKPAKRVSDVDTESFSALPKTWLRGTLDQITWSVKDGPHFSPQYEESGVPFVSGGSITPGVIDLSIAKFISPSLHEKLSIRCKPQYLDVLYTKGGTTGIAAVNTLHEEFNVWVHVAVLKLLPAKYISPFFVQHALNSRQCYTQSQRYTHGVGNQDLGLTRMINIVLPIPPVEEQNEIVRRVETLLGFADRIEARLATAQIAAERLTPALLAKAFRGELVPQDPNDEPASELLKRLAAQRAAEPKSKRTRKAD